MRIVLLIAVVLQTGCASLQTQRPPVCDGRHLRPANPYGSVLAGSAPAIEPGPPQSHPSCP